MKAQVGGEWIFILFFITVLGTLAFFMSQPDYPEGLKFVNTFDWVWFSGGIIGLSATCVIATGLPCAGALVVFGIITIWKYIIVNTEWIKILLFVPLVVTTIYIMAKLGRGGG